MRQPGDWMQNPTDDRILEVLDSGLELGPAAIGHNIDRSRSWVSQRLSVLVEHGLATQTTSGYYAITEDGRRYLTGELDASNRDN
ncbi:winged helix-turn-helix domain-containing protein [Halobacterium salinarum]|uniref:winged helix-turn-helix domain-containing protein n=1 Tax=Halobacterium salinarum TaxID=2242 RepID=UPI00255729AD|nr:helix-turn-helix transcriptional regulator [Halobacterium salinarum]MDL0133705.1 helix-turn-helix transcriptional regulator [Halobacterium salinarum]